MQISTINYPQDLSGSEQLMSKGRKHARGRRPGGGRGEGADMMRQKMPVGVKSSVFFVVLLCCPRIGWHYGPSVLPVIHFSAVVVNCWVVVFQGWQVRRIVLVVGLFM